MIEETISEQERAFLEMLKDFEDKWVATVQSEGTEIIVGSGSDAKQAKQEAEAKGFRDVVLYKVFCAGSCSLHHRTPTPQTPHTGLSQVIQG